MSITFATNCWENDWEYLLKKGYLERMISNCNYPFKEKILCIGNVSKLSEVIKYASKKIEEGVIDNYLVTDNSATEVLKFFSIDKDSFGTGFSYSIAPLSAIYYCQTELLLYFTGDAYIEKDGNLWLKQASGLLMDSDDFFVANPLWNNNYEEAKNESFRETSDSFVGYGFSDQCFLVRSTDFKKPMYNEYNIASERYPKYAGELFEKRVDSYMRNHNLYRVTSKTTSYIHQNYPLAKKSFFKRIFK